MIQRIRRRYTDFISVRANQYFLLILLLGIFLRVYQFGTLPIGLNQDEAFAGYEAFSLAHYGVDSAGYHNPVYFVSWGSGMNVLESYLAIPFVWLFGLSVYTIRMPQLICGILSVPVLYLLLREVTENKRTALIGMGLLAISPWHIMLSRWGLESNLAPAFLLFGLYFFVKGVRDNRYFILSAVFYGLTLYAYAITWAVVPLMVAGSCLYLWWSGKKFSRKYAAAFLVILFLLALPLILFVLVNNNVIPEIKTDFISVPKMLVMRDSEIKFSNIFDGESYYNLLNLLIKQSDGLEHNSTEFGLFYRFSVPFIFVGMAILLVDFVRSVRKKVYNEETFLLVALVSALLVSLMLAGININRINGVHIPLLICITIGLSRLFDYFKNAKMLVRVVAFFYAVALIFFGSYYFTRYNDDIQDNFRHGAGEAVAFVKEQGFEKVNVDTSMYYPQLLFYDQTNTLEFLETVEYRNYPAAFLSAKSFTKYTFGIDAKGDYDAYIIANRDSQKYQFSEANGYTVVEFEEFAVAYRK